MVKCLLSSLQLLLSILMHLIPLLFALAVADMSSYCISLAGTRDLSNCHHAFLRPPLPHLSSLNIREYGFAAIFLLYVSGMRGSDESPVRVTKPGVGPGVSGLTLVLSAWRDRGRDAISFRVFKTKAPSILGGIVLPSSIMSSFPSQDP